MKEKMKVSVFERTWFTVLMLIVFFPVGLFTMFKYKKFNKVIRTIVTVFFGFMLVGYLTSDSESTPSKVENKEVIQQDDKKAKEESAPVVEKAPVETKKSTKDMITAAIPKSIDNVTQVNYVEGLEGDRSPVVFIMNLSDNLTNNFMIKGAYLDAKAIIQAVDAKVGDKISSYQFMFNTKFMDKYGNESEGKALSFDYSKDTVDKINWDKILTDNFIDLSENEFVHPALTK
ncbi:hypothetical protein [Clostridium sp.]|uniref:hypothetical protein n=1 Tax=Clostridium sp. TaxID=1506 RepID=UPI0039925EA1